MLGALVKGNFLTEWLGNLLCGRDEITSSFVFVCSVYFTHTHAHTRTYTHARASKNKYTFANLSYDRAVTLFLTACIFVCILKPSCLVCFQLLSSFLSIKPQDRFILLRKCRAFPLHQSASSKFDTWSTVLVCFIYHPADIADVGGQVFWNG